MFSQPGIGVPIVFVGATGAVIVWLISGIGETSWTFDSGVGGVAGSEQAEMTTAAKRIGKK
jgi:hypothetical protein